MKFAILLFTLVISLNAQTAWQNTGLGKFIFNIVSDSVGNVFAFEDQTCMRFNYVTEMWDSVGVINDSNFVSYGLLAVGKILFTSGHTRTDFGDESYEHNIYRSEDGGTTWGCYADGIDSEYIDELHYSKDKILYAAGSVGLYKSTNLGEYWTKTNQDPGSVKLDMITTTSNGDIFVGHEWGVILRSTDGGVTFSNIDSGMTDITFYDLTVNSSNDQLFIPSFYNVYKSTDYGNYWQNIIEDTPFSSSDLEFTSIFVKDSIFIFGTGRDSHEYLGVLISYDLGNTWSALTDGLPYKATVVTILLDDKGYIHVGTYEDGSYRTMNPITSIGEEGEEVTNEFYLSQNYPNPFNPTTTIKFSIPNVGNAYYAFPTRLIVYDILGREIKTLINKNLSPGNYEVEFDGTDLPSGVYFYRLAINSDKVKSADFQAVKKMILIK